MLDRRRRRHRAAACPPTRRRWPTRWWRWPPTRTRARGWRARPRQAVRRAHLGPRAGAAGRRLPPRAGATAGRRGGAVVSPELAVLEGGARQALAPARRAATRRCASPTSRSSTASAPAASAPTSTPRPSTPSAPARSSTTSSSPAPRERHDGGRHELPSLRVVAANGYRVPLGAGALKETLRALRPDVVLLHDPFWWPVDVIACAREIGARTVAVHHGTSNLEAAALPGPSRVYAPLLRALAAPLGRAMSTRSCPTSTRWPTSAARPTMPLRLGVHEAFRPRPDVAARRPCAVCRSPRAREGRAGAPGGRGAQRGPVAAADRRQRPAGGDAAHPRAQARARGARELPARTRATASGSRTATRAPAASSCRASTRPSGSWRWRPRRAARRSPPARRRPRCTRSARSATASSRPTPTTWTARSPRRALRRRIAQAAAMIAWRHGWERVFAAETASLRDLVG